MPTSLPFHLVDAFAEQPYRGNVAGVVFDADELTDSQMKLIAREINASETAFISQANDLHRPTLVRWFTPEVEVDFCGHATLAAVHALHESGRLAGLTSRPDAVVTLDSSAGELSLRPEMLPEPHEHPIWWLSMPEPGLKPDNTNPIRTCELLGIRIEDLDSSIPAMRTRDNDLIYVVRKWHTLMEMQPKFHELGQWCRRRDIRGICVATTNTLSEAVNVQSRFFAPAVGVDEDPVTGSVHGPLAVLLVVNGEVGSAAGHSGLFCTQGRPDGRSGLVRVLTESTPSGYQVSIAGLCHMTLSGEIRVPQRQ